MMVPWFYPRDSWQSFIRLATHCLWYPSFDVGGRHIGICGRKKLGVRLLPCLTFPIIGIYIIHNILHLMTWAQKQRRSTTKVTKHFVQCLHLARRFIVSPPWQFLAPPDLPLQQGSDQLNCNSKHLLMLYEYFIKLYCVYINEQRESIFWCNLRFDRSRCDPICDAVLSRGPPPVIR